MSHTRNVSYCFMPCVRVLVWPLATHNSLSVPWYLGSILKGQSLIRGILLVSRRQLMNLSVLFGKHELKTPLDRVMKCLLSTVGCGECLTGVGDAVTARQLVLLCAPRGASEGVRSEARQEPSPPADEEPGVGSGARRTRPCGLRRMCWGQSSSYDVLTHSQFLS